MDFRWVRPFFLLKTQNLYIQFLRYAIVGGVAFIVDFSVLYMLTEYANFYYLISGGIGFIFGLLVNYYVSIFWVFSVRNISNRLVELALFSLIGIIGLGLTEFLLWLCTDVFAIYYLYSKMVAAFIVLLWNFSARKLILFSK